MRVNHLHQPLGHVGAQGLVRRLAQGHTVGNARQRSQVEQVGLELPLGRNRLAGVGELEPHVTARPAQAVIGGELQFLGEKLQPLGRPAPADAALYRGQDQRLQVLGQRGIDICQGHIGRAAHPLAALHVNPGPHRTAPLRHRHAHIGMVAQARDIHPREMGMQLPAPVLPAAPVRRENGLPEQPGQREPISPLGRRSGIDAQAVTPVAIACQDVHVLERQFRRTAQLVGPAQPSAPDEQFGLGEKPVCRRTIVSPRTGQLQPGQQNAPLWRAPDVQLGPFDIQLLEAEIPERARRHRQHHARQAQGLAPFGVKQRHIPQLDGGNQPFGTRLDGAQPHGNPQGLAGLRFQLRTVIADSRHNPAVKRPPGRRQQQAHGQQQTQ